MPALLSPICSSFAVCITAIKFVILAWRLYYECTRKPNPVGDPQPVRELKLWLDAGMSAIFVILSGFLLVFSFVGPEETGLQILLSLAGGSLIVYQVIRLSIFRKALLAFARVDICHFTVIIRRVGFGWVC